MAGEQDDVTEAFGPSIAGFLEATREVPPYRLAWLIAEFASRLGALTTRIWLADHQQRVLVHLTDADQQEPLPIEGTLAGRAFINREIIQRVEEADGIHLWMPMVDGVDRIGVLEVALASVTAQDLNSLQHFTSIATSEILTRGQYTDLFTVLRRQRPMALAAELQWQSLPPNSFSTEGVTVAGMMEPAYEVGGDCFDYAHAEDRLTFAILDAVGHDLAASVISSLALGAYRNSRRSGGDLFDSVQAIDATIRQQLGHASFATGQLGELDTTSGELRWCNAGHPAPLLVRQGKVVRSLVCPPRVPFGLDRLDAPAPQEVAFEQLEPGDAVLLYSDGVVEARRSGGEDFGVDRLMDFLHIAFAAGLSPAETLRRLSNAVLDFHNGVLQDDATTLLVVWQPDR